MSDDPYEILQVSRKAEPEVIEAAYRRLARKYHPDMDSDPAATARMQKLNWAYEILRDPVRRARYDRQARTSYKPPGEKEAPRPREPRPQTSDHTQGDKSEDRASPERRGEESVSSSETQPRPIITLFIAILLLAIYYGFAFLYSSPFAFSNTIMALSFVATAIGGFGLLSIVASKGWNPTKITIWRVLIMFVLTVYPFTVWIPCYLAGKSIARRISKGSVARFSRFYIAMYAVGAVLLSIFSFGDIGPYPNSPITNVEFSDYRDPETVCRPEIC